MDRVDAKKSRLQLHTRAITEHDHTPPPAYCHRAGFGHRMENGLVRVATDKIVSTDRRMDRYTDMKIAYAQFHIHTNIMCKFQSSTCKNVGVMPLDINDLRKFTSSRGDNSATNDSMVIKIAYAELYTTSNIVCNFEFSTCNTVGLFIWTTIIQ